MANKFTTGNSFSTGDQVTAAKLNASINSATFDTGAVDDATTEISSGAIIVKDAGITTAKLATNAVTTAKITDSNVTKAKIENLANLTVLGNVSGSSAAPAEVSILDQDDMSSDSSTAIATQQSIKAYVDGQSGSGTLGIAGGSGTGTVNLPTQTLTVAGTTNEIETTASGQTITIGLPSSITANVTGNLTGNVTGNVTGNASTATALQTARTIAGVSFDGTSNISLNTGNITEGSNEYFTTARARSSISASGDISYNSSTGVISFTDPGSPVTSVNTQTGAVVLDTDDIAEAANLYYTSARANSAIDARVTQSFVNALNVEAASVSANSVALGTDTTGPYVAAGATAGNGISGSVSSEGGTFTVTSNATNSNVGSTIVYRDASGNFDAGTITADDIGIGTSPSYKLEVNSGTTNQVALFESTDATAYIELADNTGSVQFITPANGALRIATGGAGAGSVGTSGLFIDQSQNVGIGDDTPSYKLDVNGTGRFVSDLTLDDELIHNLTGSGSLPGYSADGTGGTFGAVLEDGGTNGSSLYIARKNSWAMYLATDTALNAQSDKVVQFADLDGQTSDQANVTGSITITASATAFNTSSDYRLKENEVDITDGIDRLKELKPYRFNFIRDPSTTVDGFFAHEVSPVVPESITGSKDAVDEEGKPDYQGIDQSKLVPLLTAALQEAVAKIEALEARVATLEG